MPATLLIAVVVSALALVVAVWVLRRDPRSLGNQLFSAGVLALAFECVGSALGAATFVSSKAVMYQRWAMVSLALVPGIWLAFSLVYSRGNYGEFLRRWWVVLVVVGLTPLGLVALALDSVLEYAEQDLLTGRWQFRLGLAGTALHVLVLVASVLVLMNLERTLRAAMGTQRWRAKLVVLGIGVLFGVRIYTSSQAMLYRATEPFLDAINCGALGLACALVVVSLVRTRVFGIDVYPSHALLQRSLTVLMAGVYLLVVGLFAKIVGHFGDTSSFPAQALFVLVSLVVLTLILMSDRVRQSLQRFVSQHLRRPRYDYRQVWRTFTERTARQVKEREFSNAVAHWVSETFNVLTVSIWTVDPGKRRFHLAASTGIPSGAADPADDEEVDEAVLMEVLRGRTEPFDVDQVKEKWGEVLRRFNPDYFRKGGGRITVPLKAGDELLGLMTLGDRVGGVPFAFEDIELLKSIGDQAANSLLGIQLSRQLVEAREMEAFQTMSTFFVHDLKNVASSLSLMLKNLPVHFDNPEFRQDALKAIGRSVDRINGLISRLSELRGGLEIKPTPAELEGVVESALQQLDGERRALISQEVRPGLRLPLDREQIQKVVTNLLLNALEAIGPGGQVRVQSSRQGSWAVLSVSDTGCGMSREFLERSLFRPFQTTKKRGIGIGMYQSRRIIEAHGGRIEVESEQGKGTTFRVLLPTGERE